eukprot:gene32511-39307_t
MSELIVTVDNDQNLEASPALGIEPTNDALPPSQPTAPTPQSSNPSPIRGPSGSAFNPDRSFMKSLSAHRTVRISLHWDHISLSVATKDPKRSKFLRPVYKKKHILRDISGHAKSGELLAIMGPTGCGKTSLMNILAARVTSLDPAMTKVSGSITVNNLPRDDAKFRHMSAYVTQDDFMYAQLTVHETLIMAAHFYLPDDVSLDAKEELVTSVINELGLAKTRNTIIGNEQVRGVSGGERKRASIAVQLISNPAVLFLDEPTSGLDSFQSQAVMESMKNMSTNKRLVIAVIHQPRSSIFDMFDKLLLLSEGHVIYLGNAEDAGAYFSKRGLPLPSFFNPADYFLDILSPDARSVELEQVTSQRIAQLALAWQEEVSSQPPTPVSGKSGVDEESIPQYKLTWQRFSRNFYLLYWRSWSQITRNRAAIIFKLCLSTFFACIIGGMYNNLGRSQESIYNRQGMLFIICLNQAFNAVIAVLSTFPREKVIVNRERSAQAYDTFSYFVAKFFAELPVNIFPGLVFGTIIYWITGLRAIKFGFFILILALEIVTSTTIGLTISAVCPSADMATNFGVPLVIICFIFAGFYINLESLPIVANWFPWISFLRWAFQAMVINEFDGENFKCSANTNEQCFQTGDAVLKNLSFDKQTINEAVLGLGMVLAFSFFAAIVLLDRNRLTFLPLNHEGSKHKALE